jgi:hypothetical protein
MVISKINGNINGKNQYQLESQFQIYILHLLTNFISIVFDIAIAIDI